MSKASPGPRRIERAAKRLFDVVSSAIALIVLSPLLLYIAAGVKVTSPAPCSIAASGPAVTESRSAF